MINLIQRTWLPRALPELALWFANFNLKFAQFAGGLGLSAQVGQVEKNNETVQWLAAAMEASEANTRGLKQFRDETLFGGKNEPPPAEPVTVLPKKPDAFQISVVQWLVDFVEKKIEVADNYTEEIGVQLGIIAAKSGKPSADSVKPKGEYFAAQGGYELAVVVTNRGEADMSELQIRFANSEKWKSVKNFTGKSANAQIEPTEEGKPEQIQARIQLYKNNEKYGQPSDAVYVTVNS